MLWNRVHLTCEGYLSLCCLDYENALTYADLNTSTVQEAWHNAVVQDMRRRHLSQELEGTLCRNCLHKTNEPVWPITSIGHGEHGPVRSARAAGVRDVEARLLQLTRRVPATSR